MVYLMNAIPNILFAQVKLVQIEQISISQVQTFLKEGFVSAVGHQSTADIYSKLLGIDIPTNRITIEFKQSDLYIAGLFTLPRRLGENETLSEEEILALNINWVLIDPIC